MILKTDITNENFLVYSAQHYDTVFMDDSEFLGDLNRIVCIKKLFNTYLNKKGLKPRLILNHLIVLYNMFDYHATGMLFLRLDVEHRSILKTFLTTIGRMPDRIVTPTFTIESDSIRFDYEIYEMLKGELN